MSITVGYYLKDFLRYCIALLWNTYLQGIN